MKTVYIPKQSKYDTERFVAVNGRNMLVRTGEPVELPDEFAEVLENSLCADAEAERYVMKNARA